MNRAIGIYVLCCRDNYSSSANNNSSVLNEVSLPIPSPATSVSAARVPLNIEESIFPLVYMSAGILFGSKLSSI